MDGPDLLPAGLYRHYRGGLYQVLGLASDSTNGLDGRRVVVYIGLDLAGARPGPRMHVRAVEEFMQQVVRRGLTQPRFAYVGTEWAP